MKDILDKLDERRVLREREREHGSALLREVRQVDDAGKPSERVLAEGEGEGFLWAMNSYWRMEERDGGVYVECEAITLSRGVPLGLGMLINPMLQSFAEESLKNTLEAKRQAVRSKQ